MALMRSDYRLTRAMRRQPVDKVPVWLMRQAGRYLPEYRQLREQAGSFLKLMKTPELAAEVTLQPTRRFDVDAAIQFSDILTIPDAMGLGLNFVMGEGPVFERKIERLNDVKALPSLEPLSAFDYVLQAIRQSRKALADDLPLIGFSGAPWTLAAYMIEGHGSRDGFMKARSACYSDPELVRELTARLAGAVTSYLLAQASAGADVLMIFDTWANVLSQRDFLAYVVAPVTEIVEHLKTDEQARQCPIVYFARGLGQRVSVLSSIGVDCLGLDWTTSMADARNTIGDALALQGNLDPAALYAPEETLRAAARNICQEYGRSPGLIFNLGHGVPPDVRPEQVAALVNEVHRWPVEGAN